MTYNVHGCVGRDGVTSPERIADVIAASDPDVVAVQEVDVERQRTGGIHQPEAIAQRLGMRALFCCTLLHGLERYGHAILSRHPVELVAEGHLPTGHSPTRRMEPRAALWAEVVLGGLRLQVMATHLGLSRRERAAQTQRLCGPAWLQHPGWAGARILCGDLNAVPSSHVYHQLLDGLQDVQRSVPRYRARATWPMPRALLRIDHMFVSKELRVRQVDVPSTPLSRVASDHAPLVAEVDVLGIPHAVEADCEAHPHPGP